MKKNGLFKRIVGIMLVMGVGLLIAGCTSGPKINTSFMKTSMPKESHAVLYAEPHIFIVRIDDQGTFLTSGGQKIFALTPGAHVIEVEYHAESRDEDTITKISSEVISIDLNLAAGEYYAVSAVLGDDTVAYSVNVLADPVLKGELRATLANAKVDTPSPWSVAYASKDPTEFEGYWEADDGSSKIEFIGNTYIFYHEKQIPKMARGNFSFADDVLTLYLINAYSGSDIGTALNSTTGWSDLVIFGKGASLKFKYTLGQEVLTMDHAGGFGNNTLKKLH
jgi:hypothetical protein